MFLDLSLEDFPRNGEFDTTARFARDVPALGMDNYGTLDARSAWQPREDLGPALHVRNLIESEQRKFASTSIFNLPIEVQRSAYGTATWRL